MEMIIGNTIAEMMLIIFLGLVMGSFASMLCYRLPRDIPIMGSKNNNFSFCPNCQVQLRIFDLFPIFSWAFQHGKCRHCQVKISMQYPIIEIMTLSLAFLSYWQFGFSLKGGVVIAMAPILVSLFVIDWNFKILPNVLNLSLFLGGLAFQLIQGDDLIFYSISAIVYPASMIFIRWVFLKMTGKDGLGFGDIKFFGAAGIWLGLEIFSAYLLISSLLGIIFGLIHKALTKEDIFPFGPALIVAFLICLYTKDLILTVL